METRGRVDVFAATSAPCRRRIGFGWGADAHPRRSYGDVAKWRARTQRHRSCAAAGGGAASVTRRPQFSRRRRPWRQSKRILDARCLGGERKFYHGLSQRHGRLSGRLLTWNAGTCCAYSVINKVDDVGFVRALIDKLAEKFPIDRRRIYATGMSNGGMMAHRLAAEARDIVAAVAPVAGGMVLPVIKTARAVPVLHIHSVDDPRALYTGGLGPPFPLTNKPSVSSQHRRDDQALGRSITVALPSRWPPTGASTAPPRP